MTQSGPDWAALFKKHRQAMYGAAYAVLRGSGRTHLAEDAVSAAFESIMKAPPKRPPRSWEAYLVTAAKRRAYDAVGAATYRRDTELKAEHHPTFEHDIDAVLDHQAKVAEVKPAIAGLDERARFALLEFTAGRPRAEIAEALGVTPGRISQIVKKALEDIRAAMGESG